MKSKLNIIAGLLLVNVLFASKAIGAVMIFEIYGAGGNSGAIYQDDFIVLYNSGPSAQSLNGWSLQYASSTGSSWDVYALPNFNVGANSYFFLRLSTTGTNGAVLSTPDATTTSLGSSTTGIAASNGKLALMNTITALAISNPIGNANLVDFLGYGTANAFEGAGAAPSPSTTSVIHRILPAHQDTNNNNNDFVNRSQSGATTFPVTIYNLEASQAGNAVSVHWNAESEINFAGYGIQKSRDAIGFESIGFVEASGQSAYSFTDTSPQEGWNYYRLEMKDLNGESALSRIVSALYLPDGEVLVYPNPVAPMQEIQVQSMKGLEIFTLDGKAINLPDKEIRLPSGSYLFQVNNGFTFETKRVLVR